MKQVPGAANHQQSRIPASNRAATVLTGLPGGGLPELRKLLAAEGYPDPLWYEVPKSRKAPKYARRALKHGADVLFIWGGDGTVQRCIDALAGTGAVLAILPAGAANLLATNLKVPGDLEAAVRTGLHAERRPVDTGSVHGEHFAVMAGRRVRCPDDQGS